MNHDYKHTLTFLMATYEDAKKNYNVDRMNQTIKLINRIRDKYNSYFTEINDKNSIDQLAAMLKDFDEDQLSNIAGETKLPAGKIRFGRIKKFLKSKTVKLALAGSMLVIPTSCVMGDKKLDGAIAANTVELANTKENDKDYLSTNLVDNGVNFAELSAKYGQYIGYTSEDLAYLSTEFTGHVPAPHTAAKFNMPGLISEGDAAKAISHVKTTYDNMFHLGLKEEDKDAVLKLFNNEDDKKIIGSALDIYYDIYKQPTSTEAKDKLIEKLKDYNNQDNTASTDMANLFLASLFDASRGIALVGDRTEQDKQIDILTDAIVKDINTNTMAKGKDCAIFDEKTLDLSIKKDVTTIIENGLKEEDKATILSLLDNEDDKKIVEEALNVYLEVTKDSSSTEAKAKLIENLKDYKNQNETAVTTKGNSVLVPLYISAREKTLVGDKNEQSQEIDVLTKTIVTDYSQKKSIDDNKNLTESQSVYTNIRNNLKYNYQDFVNQANQAKNTPGETTLDKSGKEIAAEIALKTKDLKNSEIDVTEEIANGYRERYDNSPEEQARVKVGPNDVIKQDPKTGEKYIDGGKTSEDMTEQQLPNKDVNGNDTNMSTEEMVDYAKLAADHVNAGTRDENLYNTNSVYKNAWDQFKAFQDANNVKPPEKDNVVSDQTETETKPVTNNDQGSNPSNGESSSQNNEQINNQQPEEELPTVPDDYVDPTPGEEVEVKEEVEIVPVTQQLTEEEIANQQMSNYSVNADGTWNEFDGPVKTR